MQMISSRTIPLLNDQTLALGELREVLFRDEHYGFILYLSDGPSPSKPNERIVRLEMRDALIWLNQAFQDGEFCS